MMDRNVRCWLGWVILTDVMTLYFPFFFPFPIFQTPPEIQGISEKFSQTSLHLLLGRWSMATSQ